MEFNEEEVLKQLLACEDLDLNKNTGAEGTALCKAAVGNQEILETDKQNQYVEPIR